MPDDPEPDIEELDATTDHATIRAWVEEHGGFPAHVAQSEGQGDQGLLRVGFTDADNEEQLKDISWDAFFEEFEEKDLAFVYREKPPRDENQPVVRLVERDRVDA